MFYWFDIIIVFVVLLYIFEGYRQGFIKTTIDILGVALALFLALRYYNIAGTLFVSWGLDKNLAKPVGFFGLWFTVQLLCYLITSLIFHCIPRLMQTSQITRGLGILPGLIKGLMIVTILLIILMTLPFSSNFKNQLSGAYIAGFLIKSTAEIESQMAGIFGQMNDSLTLYTISTEQNGNSQLNFKTNNYKISESDETMMIDLTNKERRKVGLGPLKPDTLLRNVARAYAIDMLGNGYFSHTNPAGQTPFDRLAAANVSFNVAGENLALAPSIDLAHLGLMNSPSHRDNILDSKYTRIGIGVIDAGPYGKMIVQEFSG